MALDVITNFQVYSVELSDDQTKITFSFTKPDNDDVGGYYLWMSSTGVEYTNVKVRIDAEHPQDDADNTTDVDGISYFEYTLTSTGTEGMLLYFKLQWLSTSRAFYGLTAAVSAYTYPTTPENLFVKYDGFRATLTWDDLDYTDNRNSTFSQFNIYRDLAEAVNEVTYDADTEKLENSSFAIGDYIWVVDNFRKYQWWGQVTTAEEFPLSTTKISGESGTAENYIVTMDNLSVFKETGSPQLIGTSSDSLHADETHTEGTKYIYSVRSSGLGGLLSNPDTYKCDVIAVTMAYPYLRPVENSSTGLLSNIYWKKIKNALVDKNYYDKSAFAIPYATNTSFNLKGYLGVSDCRLDLYVNGGYSSSTSTGEYGEFEIDYIFPKGVTEIKLQARDGLNINFSRLSAPYSIRTLNIYSMYSIWGEQYEDMGEELDSVDSDVALDDCRYTYFEDKFSPFTGIYKIADEDEAKFREISSAVFKAFEYVSYDRSIETILDAFRDNITEFDHYQIYYNNDLYNTQRTQYTFTITSTGLERDDYYYGVSSCTSTGEETPVSELRVDRRWWPPPYTGASVLLWDYMEGADSYKIYRGSTSSTLQLMIQTEHNVFVDTNALTSTGPVPVEYNFTDLESPTNFYLYNRYSVNNLHLRLKKPNSLVILLFGKDDSLIPEVEIDRLISLFAKFIPPELLYTLVFANNSTVILYPDGTEIDLTEIFEFAKYGLSYYYHSDIENEVYS